MSTAEGGGGEAGGHVDWCFSLFLFKSPWLFWDVFSKIGWSRRCPFLKIIPNCWRKFKNAKPTILFFFFCGATIRLSDSAAGHESHSQLHSIVRSCGRCGRSRGQAFRLACRAQYSYHDQRITKRGWSGWLFLVHMLGLTTSRDGFCILYLGKIYIATEPETFKREQYYEIFRGLRYILAFGWPSDIKCCNVPHEFLHWRFSTYKACA